MEKAKVGIITFHYAHNYGAMLQAYALKTFLTENGFDAEIVNYVPEYMKFKYYKASLVEIIKSLNKTVIWGLIKRRKNIIKFNEFESKELGLDKVKKIDIRSLNSGTSQYDYLVFGSDQIWNTNIIKGDASYFGNFGFGKNKISYAASSGNVIDTDVYKKMVATYLPDFRAISVRESNAKTVLSQILNKEIVQVLDPVFLLKREMWNSLSQKSSFNSNAKYVFYYSIEKNSDLVNECNSFANENGLAIYSANGEMKKHNEKARLLSGVGPLEFLALIRNADTIFTNSFHALAFSIIFNKRVFIRTHSETGNRVMDLLKECGLDYDGKDLFEINGDYYSIMRSAIVKSKDFLINSFYTEK